MKNILMVLFLLLSSRIAIASDYKFMEIVNSTDIEVILSDFFQVRPMIAGYEKMTVRIKGKRDVVYIVGKNSNDYFTKNDGLFAKLKKIRSLSERKVFLALPNEIDTYKSQVVLLKQLPKNGAIIRNEKGIFGIIDPGKYNLTFENVGPFYNQDGAVSISINGSKISRLDGFGLHAPQNLDSGTGTIEEVFNDEILKITLKDGSYEEGSRLYFSTNTAGSFRIFSFILKDEITR